MRGAGDLGRGDLVVRVEVVEEDAEYERGARGVLVVKDQIELGQALEGYSRVINHVSGTKQIRLHYPYPIYDSCKLLA